MIDPPRALWVGVAVLIVTCPCALSLAAPSALVAAAGGLARRGVLFRRLEAIETLAAATRLFVDKTGTLTEDRPALVEVAPLPGASIDAAGATAVAASLAEWSTHPLSRALAAAAGRDGAAAGLDWSDPSEQPGQGLQARDPNGRTWRLGSWHWTGGAGEAPLPAQVWLGREGHPLAAFRFDEVLREGAAEAVSSLRARGLAITLLSGDSAERAAAMAARLGLADVVGSATPEGKLEQVAAAQSAGETVAMLGDGINDAPVLARADVSLAMGQGALVARAHADAVIVSSRPADLVRARDTARRSVRIVRQNLLWAAVYNAACIPLAMAGLLPPWAAGLGMASSSLLVILNSLRAAR